MTSLPTFTFSPHPPASVVSSPSASTPGQVFSVIQPPQPAQLAADPAGQIAGTTSGGATVQLLDLPSATAAGTQQATVANPEESGVLLCNLDELSRYIPENFYLPDGFSDGTSAAAPGVQTTKPGSAVPDYLETVVAGKGITTTAGTTAAATVATQLQPAAVNTALQPATVTQQQPQTVIQPAFSMAGTTVQAGQPQQLLASPGGTTCPTVV